MDWEAIRPELAAFNKWRWDVSETALREAKARCGSAGHRKGPMLPFRFPGPGGSGNRSWAAATGWARGVRPGSRRSRCAPRERAPRRAPSTARDLSFARAVRAVLSSDPLGARLLQDCDQRNGQYRETPRRGPAPRPAKSKVPLVLRAREDTRAPSPHRPRLHHHGQHPGLRSTNIAPARPRNPAGLWTGRSRRDNDRPPACPPEENYPQ